MFIKGRISKVCYRGAPSPPTTLDQLIKNLNSLGFAWGIILPHWTVYFLLRFYIIIQEFIEFTILDFSFYVFFLLFRWSIISLIFKTSYLPYDLSKGHLLTTNERIVLTGKSFDYNAQTTHDNSKFSEYGLWKLFFVRHGISLDAHRVSTKLRYPISLENSDFFNSGFWSTQIYSVLLRVTFCDIRKPRYTSFHVLSGQVIFAGSMTVVVLSCILQTEQNASYWDPGGALNRFDGLIWNWTPYIYDLVDDLLVTSESNWCKYFGVVGKHR